VTETEPTHGSRSSEPDFTPEQYARSRARKRATAPLRYSSTATGLVVVCGLGFSPLGSGLSRVAGEAAGGGWAATAVLGALALRIVLWLAAFPFSWWRERIDHAWGLSTRTRRLYWLDSLRGFLLLALLMAGVSAGFFALTRNAPHLWPVIVGACGVALVFVFSFLLPVVVEPLFNKFRPLEPGQLRERLLEVARASGVRVRDVLVSDASKRTTADNAYVSGFGRTRRIVLWDTTIEHCSPDEIASVTAHELGHAARRDVLVGTALSACAVAASVAVLDWALGLRGLREAADVSGAADPRALALCLAVSSVLGGFLGPLFNGYSRRIERRADQYALDLTRDPGSMISTWRRLAVRNISDLEPRRLSVLLFFTHPPVPDRIGHARRWEAFAHSEHRREQPSPE
jgi:STE24 endopeptidase